MEQYTREGFVTSLAEWESDVNAVGAAIDLGDGREPDGINIGGSASNLTKERLEQDLGPRLAIAARRLQGILRADA